MTTYTFIIFLHIIGTILGTGGSTIAEIQITKALKDSRVSDDERSLMHANYFMIRVGMAFIIVSALAMVVYYALDGNPAMVLSDKVWIKEFMFLMIIINAIALTRRWVPLWLGASISFTSWWGATFLGAAGYLPYSFLTYLIGYIVAIFAMAGLLHLIRNRK